MKRWFPVLTVAVAAGIAYAHLFLPQKIEASLNVVMPHEPYAISDAAQRLHDSMLVVDLHSDSLLWKRDLRERAEIGHMDLPRLRDGNVALQVFSATTKSPAGLNYDRNTAESDRITLLAIASFWPPRTWFSLYERALYQLDKLKRLASDGELLMISNRHDLQSLMARRAAGESVIGAMFLIEGGHPLEGSLERLDRLHEQGLRIIGLTHFFDNELGGSLHGVDGSGLTDFGRAVVRRANELGVIIDVAHASPATVADVLEISTAPVLLSHGGLEGACDSRRNLPDVLMRKIAAKGGLIGIGYWAAAVCEANPAGIVRSIRYAINELGVDHVALGSDYDGAITAPFDTSELAILTQTMLQQGFSRDEIRKVMGANAVRLLLELLPAQPAPAPAP